MTLTNFPNGVSSFGVQLPAGGGLPVTTGKYIFVDYGAGSDGNTGESAEEAVKTVAQAYSMARTNKDDVIVLIGNTTHTLTSMLTVAKNRVHFVGLDASGGRQYGQNAKINLGVTTAATDIATILVTGVRCSFENIKVLNENTVAEGIYGFIDAGEYTRINNMEVFKSTDLDVTGAADFVCNADSSYYTNCTFGSNAAARVGAVIRAPILLTKAIVAGKVARDVTFERCQTWVWASDTACAHVWSTTATDVERKMEFRDCLFNTTKNSTATPAVAVGGAAALTAGEILLTGTTAENGCTALATQTGIISALPTYAAGGGSAIQAT